MKKSQLRNIIRESIKELMTEQSNSNVNVSPGDVVAVAAAYPIITNPQDLPMNTTPGANPFMYIYANQPFPGNVYLPPGPNSYSSVSSCGTARSYGINTQAEADAFNSVMNGENGVYLELVSNPNSIANAVDNVLAQLNADFNGPVHSCTYVGPTGTSSTVSNTNYMPGGVGNVTPLGSKKPQAISNDTKFATPTPNPNDPQMKRMKDLAFQRKR